MKKTLLSLLICAALALSGCGARQGHADSAALQVAATTYPVYLLTQAVTEGIDGVEGKLVIDQQVSCLHNYTRSAMQTAACFRPWKRPMYWWKTAQGWRIFWMMCWTDGT